jgi:hypothetical protein
MQCSLLHKSGLTKQTTARKEKQAKKFNQSKLGRDFTSYQIIKKIRKKKKKKKKGSKSYLKEKSAPGKIPLRKMTYRKTVSNQILQQILSSITRTLCLRTNPRKQKWRWRIGDGASAAQMRDTEREYRFW